MDAAEKTAKALEDAGKAKDKELEEKDQVIDQLRADLAKKGGNGTSESNGNGKDEAALKGKKDEIKPEKKKEEVDKYIRYKCANDMTNPKYDSEFKESIQNSEDFWKR